MRQGEFFKMIKTNFGIQVSESENERLKTRFGLKKIDIIFLFQNCVLALYEAFLQPKDARKKVFQVDQRQFL